MKTMIKNGRLIRLAVLQVTNCDDCGACCRHMGTPPGYAAFNIVGGGTAYWAKGSDDETRYFSMPQELRDELRHYYDGVLSGKLMDRTADLEDSTSVMRAIADGRLDIKHLDLAMTQMKYGSNAVTAIPCLWYDSDSKKCKHYEWRPETCRDSEVMAPGNEACLATRRAFRIPLPLA